MNAFITTVAGMATRFSKDLSEPYLKCIYSLGNPSETLLYRLLSLAKEYDVLVVVGGYQYTALTAYISAHIPGELQKKILLVENTHFSDYGSGWSLYLAVQALIRKSVHYDEILFAEGDVYTDAKSFESVIKTHENIITVNNEPIEAKKAVAVYLDVSAKPHYVYDISHGTLKIEDAFTAIYNSAQIWKFTQIPILFSVAQAMAEQEHHGTNLVLINKYYQHEQVTLPHIKRMAQWINCNTVADFKRIPF